MRFFDAIFQSRAVQTSGGKAQGAAERVQVERVQVERVQVERVQVERVQQDQRNDLRDELSFHIEMLQSDLEQEGHTPQEAARLAQLRFGDRDKIFNACLRQIQSDSTMLQKVHFALTLVLILALTFAMYGWSRTSLNQAEESQALRVSIEGLLGQVQAASVPSSLVPRSNIAVGDTIKLFDQERPFEFDKQQTVSLDGKLLIKNLGWVTVEGSTLAQLEQQLNESLALYYTSAPNVAAAFVTRVPNPQGALTEILIQPFDRLWVTNVLAEGADTIASQSEVQVDGSVHLPELGRILVVGKSREYLEQELTEEYSQYFVEPIDMKVRVERLQGAFLYKSL